MIDDTTLNYDGYKNKDIGNFHKQINCVFDDGTSANVSFEIVQ